MKPSAAVLLAAILGWVAFSQSASAIASNSEPAPIAGEGIARIGFRVKTEDGVRISVHEVRTSNATKGLEPLILLHGARVPGLASFDLPVPGGSLAADLARQTHRLVFIMDAR